MKNSKFKIQILRFIFCVLLFAFCLSADAQSTNQDFPTPVTTSEINGKISARDVGDPRLTNYFYVFNAAQGDVFINVTATNLNGDIDVFTIGSLRPLTKISLYAGDGATETGRVIYLRKPEKLILRIEGRTPNDNPATFRIKFAGSFVPLEAGGETQEPKLPEIKPDENSNIRVNSVGTIIEIKPKPTPKEIIAKVEKENPPDNKVKEEEKKENAETEEEKPTKIVADETPKAGEETPVKPPKRRRTPPASGTSRKRTPARTGTTKTPPKNVAPKTEPPKETPPPNPLASVRLIVLFKDGTRLERPMDEVSRVNVDNKGMLTIVLKDGKIERHSILDVTKMTIE